MKLSSVASFVIGMQMLRTNPMRTLLSTLGVIIGVASLVAILALGDGLEQYSRGQLQTTTSFQTIGVQPKLTDNYEGVLVRRDSIVSLSDEDRLALQAELGDRAAVTLVLSGSAMLRAVDDSTAGIGTLVTATTALKSGGEELAAGRFFNAGDMNPERDVAVISSGAAERLFRRPAEAIGEVVTLDGQGFRVIGVLAGSEERMARTLVPLTDAMRDRLSDGGRRTPGLLVQVERIEDVADVEQDVVQWLRRTLGSLDGVTVASSTMRAEQARQGILVFKLALGSITGISILVGGIGIMNVLLAAVSERTREIGVRRATGASRGDVFLQFLAESVAVSGLGSLIGVLLGLGGAYGITAMIRHFTEARVYAGFTWGTVLVAALAAVFVGVTFGSYPARHAARLSPIEAIRHE